jgi:hypothetical protein
LSRLGCVVGRCLAVVLSLRLCCAFSGQRDKRAAAAGACVPDGRGGRGRPDLRAEVKSRLGAVVDRAVAD